MKSPAISNCIIKGDNGLVSILPSNNNVLLLDGDMLIYRAAWATNSKPLAEAKQSLINILDGIVNTLDSTNYCFYLTSPDMGFREMAYPIYKHSRLASNKPKPVHKNDLYRFVRDRYKTEERSGFEADDLILDQMRAGLNSDCEPICVSLDKDLKTTEGWNYNFVSKELEWINRDKADYLFASQLITGDTVDDIPGLSEKHPKRRTIIPKKFLSEYLKEDWPEAIITLYKNKYGSDGEYMFYLNFLLLHIGTEGAAENLIKLKEYENENW